MYFLNINSISKVEDEEVLKDISFNQQRHQKIGIAGETGSGKSTLLKVIAGLVQPDAGEVFFEGERVKGPEEKLIPGHPEIAYLSQHFELQKFLRVEQVLSYANKLTDERFDTIVEVCQIGHLLERKTDRLSGGERQRTALAKLLITSPRLLLLDEPFSNLDMHHKRTLKTVIDDIPEKFGTSKILVSHDPEDVLSWADIILVLRSGGVIQMGTPEEIYRNPVSEYVAGLFGKYNLIKTANFNLLSGVPGIILQGKGGGIIRPEDFKITAKESNALKGKVARASFYGGYYELAVDLQNVQVTVKTQENNFHIGDTVFLTADPEDIVEF